MKGKLLRITQGEKKVRPRSNTFRDHSSFSVLLPVVKKNLRKKNQSRAPAMATLPAARAVVKCVKITFMDRSSCQPNREKKLQSSIDFAISAINPHRRRICPHFQSQFSFYLIFANDFTAMK